MAISPPRPAPARFTFGRIRAQSDLILGALVLVIVAMLIVPLPKQVLDVLITANLAGALLILMVSLYTKEPLQFSTFPSILLLATLFRLGLSVLATRLILLQGDAGQVIAAFGEFVIGGNFVVGVVVFLILVVIQFVVITNGAGRVAEVAARFTLDAMPGKQMSIDAELNAGAIDETEARRRRRAIEAEADFYGAMDGASKFVKGDAIAGIIIIFINSIGGFTIGVVQLGLPFEEALRRYTLLTVGDGLVTQIPALLISTATGIIVTRSASNADMGQDLVDQVFTNPRALAMVAVVLTALALVPGIPKLPFLLIAAAIGGLAFLLKNAPAPQADAAAGTPALPERESLMDLLHVDPMELEVGFGLVPLVDPAQPGNLLNRITQVRRQLATDLGLLMPTVRVHDSIELSPHAYNIKLRGSVVAAGEVRPDRFLALNPGVAEQGLDGIATTEPAFGLPALWIGRDDRERADLLGYTVVDPASVIATHLTETVKNQAHLVLSRQDVQALVDNLKRDHPAVIDDLIPRILSLTDVHRMLQELLREQVPIRDLLTVMESLAGTARITTDPEVLAESVRESLSRSLCAKYAGSDSSLPVLMLEVGLQDELMKALQMYENRTALALEPDHGQLLLQAMAAGMEQAATQGFTPVLLVPPSLRRPLRRYLEASLPRLVVLSVTEVPAGMRVRSVGMVSA